MREPPEFADHPVSFDEAAAAGLTRAVMIGGIWTVDGDTAYARLDYGWWDYGWKSVRFADIDAPEIHHAEDEAELEVGRAARDYLRERFFVPPLEGYNHALLRSSKDTSIGRIVSVVLVPETVDDLPSISVGGIEWTSVGAVLVNEGLAEPREGA